MVPAADVDRDADSVKVSIDLPGMKAEDVKVEVRDGYLMIPGNRETDREEKSEGTYSREARWVASPGASRFRQASTPKTSRPGSRTES